MNLVIDKQPPMEPVTVRLPPSIRKQAQAAAAEQQASERDVYRAIIENFFGASDTNCMRNRIQNSDEPETNLTPEA